mgnify:CR=1 FL=1
MNAIVYTFLIVIIMGGLTVILIALRDKKRKKADAVRIKTDKKANRLNKFLFQIEIVRYQTFHQMSYIVLYRIVNHPNMMHQMHKYLQYIRQYIQ